VAQWLTCLARKQWMPDKLKFEVSQKLPKCVVIYYFAISLLIKNTDISSVCLFNYIIIYTPM